jgi:hypothetical protein
VRGEGYRAFSICEIIPLSNNTFFYFHQFFFRSANYRLSFYLFKSFTVPTTPIGTKKYPRKCQRQKKKRTTCDGQVSLRHLVVPRSSGLRLEIFPRVYFNALVTPASHL